MEKQAGTFPLERLALASGPAHDDGEAETEQAGADDRSGDLRVDDLDLSLRQDEQREQQLRHAAEADRQQPADGRTGVLCKLFRRGADPVGHNAHAQYAGQEYPDRGGADHVVQRRRDRHDGQERQPQHHTVSRPIHFPRKADRCVPVVPCATTEAAAARLTTGQSPATPVRSCASSA